MNENRLISRPFAMCFAANLLQGLAFSLFLHFPGYLLQLGADEAQIGLISGLTAIAAIAVRPPVGRAMDRRGRRVVILWGGALNVLAVGLYLTVHSIGAWIYVVRILHGLAEALLFSSLFTYAADFVPADRRTQGLALFGVSGMLPMSLGGLLGDQLLSRWEYSALFLVSLGLAALSLLCSIPLADRPRTSAEEEPSRGITAALVQRDLRPLWLIGTVFSIAITVFFVFIKTFVEETGIGSVGLFFTTYTASALVLRVFFGWLPDRYGPKRVLLPALLAQVTGFLLMAAASTAFDVGVAGALCGIGHGYTFPILFGLVVTRARDADRGSAMAIFTALFDLGVLVGGPCFGLVIQQGGYSVMFRSAAAFTTVGSLVFFLWDGRRSVQALRCRRELHPD
jgi:MFS family permease